MNFIGYIFIALAKVTGIILNLYTWVIIISALLSWVSPDPYNPIVRILHNLTQPVYSKVRRYMPRMLLRSQIDITPIIVLLLIVMLETILTGTLYDLGATFLVK
jgi:YggT family protein